MIALIILCVALMLVVLAGVVAMLLGAHHRIDRLEKAVHRNSRPFPAGAQDFQPVNNPH